MLLSVLVLAGGCLATSPPDAATRPTLLDPRWRNEAFDRHLNFFRDAAGESAPNAAGRKEPSGSVAAYVRAALRRAWVQPAVEGRYRLWRASDSADGYVGYVGYVAGKNPNTPEGMDEPAAAGAVLVCADLSSERPAVEAAALLELARVYGVASQYTLMPERSVIFGLWAQPPSAAAGEAGPNDPLAGLRAYLRRPTWRLDRVRAVFYMGLPAERRAEAQALLDEHQIPLYSVSLPAAPAPSDTTRRAMNSEDTAVARARALADRTHRRLRAATLTRGKMMPSLGDTIRVPVGERP